jgi:hypothetical protein
MAVRFTRLATTHRRYINCCFTLLSSLRAPISLVCVMAFVDLGAQHPATRLEHFLTLASSGTGLIVFVSTSYMGMTEELQVEYPNILRIEPVKVESLTTVQTINPIVPRLAAALLLERAQEHARLPQADAFQG